MEERIFRDFAVALPRLRASGDPALRMTCVFTLSNCLNSSVRPYVVVQLLTLLKALDLATPEVRPLVARVGHMLTCFEDSRHALVDGGLTGLLASIIGQLVSRRRAEGEPAEADMCRQLAAALCNLTCFSDGRTRMVGEGAVRAAVLLAGFSADDSVVRPCLSAMLNLSALPAQAPVFILNKSLALLAALAARLTQRDALLTLADVLFNLCAAEATVDKVVNDGAHLSLIRLATRTTRGVDRCAVYLPV
jgi:hypothetical protein